MKLSFVLLLLQLPLCISAYSAGGIGDLYDSAERMEYSNPTKALKFTRYIIANTDKTSSGTDIFKALLLQSEIQIGQQNISGATLSLSKCSKLIESGKNSFLLTKYYFLLAKILLQLNMTEQFENKMIQIKNVSASLNKPQSESAKNWFLELNILNAVHAGDFQESLKLIPRSGNISDLSDTGFHDRILLIKKELLLRTGDFNTEKKTFKTPFYSYLSRVLEMTNDAKEGHFNSDSLKVLQKENLYFGGENSLNLYKQISIASCANSSEADCFYYKNEYLKHLKNKVTNYQNARLTVLNILQDNAQFFQQRAKKNWITAAMISGIVAFTLLFGLMIYYFYLKSKLKKLTARNENEKMYDDLKNKFSLQPKTIPIPAKTEQLILQKLLDFEHTEQYLNPQISLSFLSSSLETNSKYLSEVINKHKDKNFNTYINELRINYIITKLKNNPTYRQYKSSFLANEAGFASRTSFSTIFKSVAGKSLTQYIEKIEDDQK